MKKHLLLMFALVATLCGYAQTWQSVPSNGVAKKAISHVNKSTIAPTGDEVWWGYFNENDYNGEQNIGTGRAATFVTAIHVAANNEQIGNGTIKAVRVYIGNGVASTMSNMKVWISKTLPNTADDADYVQNITATLNDGANDFKLTTPYEINNGAFYIGYSVKSTNAYPINAGGNDKKDAFLISSPTLGMSWEDLNGYNFGMLAFQILVSGPTITDYSATPDNFGPGVVGLGQTADIPVGIANNGKQTITSLSYIVTQNGSTSEEKTVSSLSIPFNGYEKVNFNFPAAASEGMNSYTLTITKINGNANTASVNSATGNIQTVTDLKTYPRTVLIEEFTGESCGNCPRAVGNLASTMTSYPDLAAQVAIVCHHAGYYSDWLTIPADENYTWFFNNGGATYAPAFMWDRHADDGSTTPVISDMSVADNAAMIRERLEDPSYACIRLNTSFNSNQTKLTVDVDCERAWQFCSTPECVTLILTEDNIKARSQSGGGSNFVHQHVSRAVNETWGSVLSWNDNKATYSYTFDINSSWKVADLKVVGFISGYDSSDPTNCVVANAAVVKAGEATGITPISAAKTEACGYFTLDGRQVSHLQKGMMLVRMTDGTVKKVVVK